MTGYFADRVRVSLDHQPRGLRACLVTPELSPGNEELLVGREPGQGAGLQRGGNHLGRLLGRRRSRTEGERRLQPAEPLDDVAHRQQLVPHQVLDARLRRRREVLFDILAAQGLAAELVRLLDALLPITPVLGPCSAPLRQPRFRAALFPRGAACRITRTRGLRSWFNNSAVSSVKPSSMTIASRSTPRWLRTMASASASRRLRLCVGTTTDTAGGENVIEDRPIGWSLSQHGSLMRLPPHRPRWDPAAFLHQYRVRMAPRRA